MRPLANRLSNIQFIVNREVRVVPRDWRHPEDDRGHPVPLFLEGMPPVVGLPADRLGLVVYETTSEGTPCFPVFPSTAAGRESLIGYCVEHISVFADQMGTRADRERAILRDEVIAIPAKSHLDPRDGRSTRPLHKRAGGKGAARQ